MGWRGLLRDMQARSRRNERNAHRQRRALEKERAGLVKLHAEAVARYDVAVYENQIELLTSVHKECGESWDWSSILNSEAPEKPRPTNAQEAAAAKEFEQFSPSVWDRLFQKAEKKREALRVAVEVAKRRDKEDLQRALKTHAEAVADWENSRQFAELILKGDLQAYRDAIHETSPFRDIDVLGSVLKFSLPNAAIIKATVHVNGPAVIPSEVKSLLKSGKLSTKPMPSTRFAELYQDYVCGCALRIARELMALLPLRMVIVTALGEVLDAKTGFQSEKPILSVAVPRETLTKIRWETVDPSDAMSNFVHRMCFKKGKGMFAVEPIELTELADFGADS